MHKALDKNPRCFRREEDTAMAQGRPEASGNRAEETSNQSSALVSAFAARKAPKNPFADITNRDRGISNRAPETHSVANNNDATPPPLKRQRLGYDKKVAPRQLSSKRVLRPRRIASSERVPDVHQANHRTVIVRTASATRTSQQIPTQPRNHINYAERHRGSEEEKYDTEYGTDIEDDACVFLQAHDPLLIHTQL